MSRIKVISVEISFTRDKIPTDFVEISHAAKYSSYKEVWAMTINVSGADFPAIYNAWNTCTIGETFSILLEVENVHMERMQHQFIDVLKIVDVYSTNMVCVSGGISEADRVSESAAIYEVELICTV